MSNRTVTTESQLTQYSNLIVLALRAAIEAGEEILEVYESRGEIEVSRKADRTPLTEADMRAHRRILALLAEPAGGDQALGEALPVLSEEASDIPFDRRESWDRYWLVDPLDGTKEFIKRNGEFTVNIAYVERGEPRAGVVYAPVLKRAYLGVVGIGAYRLDEVSPGSVPEQWDEVVESATRLPRAAEPAAPRPYTVVASRSHMSSETEQFVEELREEHPDLELVSAGSALKLCLVAEGSADVYPRFAPTMEWDTAAGHAVCAAVGVEVNSWPAERPLEYNKPDLVNPWFLVRRA